MFEFLRSAITREQDKIKFMLCVTSITQFVNTKLNNIIVQMWFVFRTVMKEYLRRQDEKEGIRNNENINPFKEREDAGRTGSGTGGGDNPQRQKKIGAQQILVLLLRLRQCCSHLSLMKDVCYHSYCIGWICTGLFSRSEDYNVMLFANYWIWCLCMWSLLFIREYSNIWAL